MLTLGAFPVIIIKLQHQMLTVINVGDSAWLENAKNNLLPLSVSKDFHTALLEWEATGELQILDHRAGKCGLCEHHPIRYMNKIKNTSTNNDLWVGSECIKKFIDRFPNGQILKNPKDKSKRIYSWLLSARKVFLKQKASAILKSLSEKDEIFKDRSWEYGLYNCYSIKQVLKILVCCKKHSIPFRASCFQIKLQKKRIREQVEGLDQWQYKCIRAAFSTSARRKYDDFFKL